MQIMTKKKKMIKDEINSYYNLRQFTRDKLHRTMLPDTEEFVDFCIKGAAYLQNGYNVELYNKLLKFDSRFKGVVDEIYQRFFVE